MLKDKLKGYTIVLASGSPRRQHFLKDLDANFEVRLKEVEEIYPDTLQGAEITDYLAELKASALEESLSDDEILIASDTIVWHEGKALGKPKDKEDAFNMIKSLSGKTHEVITSVCIKNAGNSETFHEITKVTFNPITDEEIRYYLEEYKPYDKAGAYGIQEWIGIVAIARIEGSYANVVGMPVDKVYQQLMKFAK